MLDLIIEGGQVVDGTGRERFRADVAVHGGRIVAVGELRGHSAVRRHDAGGLVVAPGFIDAHTHDDRLLLQHAPDPHPKLSQGVTTVIAGNCGVSLAPLRTGNDEVPPPLDILGCDGWRFDSFSDYLAALDEQGIVMNAACLVGHTTLRVRHVGELDRPATAAETGRMASDLDAALQAGALGMSIGLYYPPARAATLAEVVSVGAPLKRHGGVVAMHLRDEADAMTDAMREGFEIGRALGVQTVLSHHKLIGRRNHGRSNETLAMVEATAREQPVCVDCYPYNASSTMLLESRVSQSSEVVITWSQARPDAAGQSLFALASAAGTDAATMVQRLSPAGAVYFAMDEADVSRILAHPLTMVGSDGLAHDKVPHPRLWGTFPRVLGHYARDRQLFGLETAVHKMTGLTARRFGLHDRGVLQAGHAADIVVFDPATVADRATYAQPTLPSVGIQAVFVNGLLACEEGRVRHAHAGQVLRARRRQ